MLSPVTLSDSRVANLAARHVFDAWVLLADRHRIITRRAGLRFASQDWKAMAADHVERLDLYTRHASRAGIEVVEVLGARRHDRMVWAGMKAVYSGLIADRVDQELAETFFNSVTRRVFTTVGVDEHIEFVDTDFDTPPGETPGLKVIHQGGSDIPAILAEVVRAAGFVTPFVDLGADCVAAAALIDQRLRRVGALRSIDRVEMINAVFYRGAAAYLVGRFRTGAHVLPIALAVVHGEGGLVIDAVLLTENQLSILFSFTRSYFHVDVESPRALVDFLSTLVPRKRRAELYISLGYDKHGKTELYRELRRHLADFSETFQVARGVPGLVMAVFTLPGFDVVFKVIRDRFGEPKKLTRDHVRNRYRLVFHHDRAGRLVDAQEFEHLEFPVDRFEPGLLDTLREVCGREVSVTEDMVHIAHCYIERRVTPLDIYLREADPDLAEAAVIDYGQAIKDLAASGIFPGDMLLKNFGVTRHGRVVFYDYDELTALADCSFRPIPPAPSIDEEMSSDPWFPTGPEDIFPEEFPRFLGLDGRLREAFMQHHADIFDHRSWNEWKRRTVAGERMAVYPYESRYRLVRT